MDTTALGAAARHAAPKNSEIHSLPQRSGTGMWGTARRLALILLGAVIMALNLNSFVPFGGTLPGGFAGVAILIQRIAETYWNRTIPYTPLYLLLNAAPVVISFLFIGKKFTLYSLVMIVASSLLTDAIPAITPLPAFTDDPVICAVFGGVCNAAAVYCCLLAGATSGGTDFIAIFISERFGKDAWNQILAFNMLVLAVSGMLFYWETALYSMVFQFVSTQTLNYLYKRYKKATLLVITDHWEEVYHLIRDTTNHDATLFTGTGCYQGSTRYLLYSVVSADEVRRLCPKIRQIDSHAFINIMKTQELLGSFYRKPND